MQLKPSWFKTCQWNCDFHLFYCCCVVTAQRLKVLHADWNWFQVTHLKAAFTPNTTNQITSDVVPTFWFWPPTSLLSTCSGHVCSRELGADVASGFFQLRRQATRHWSSSRSVWTQPKVPQVRTSDTWASGGTASPCFITSRCRRRWGLNSFRVFASARLIVGLIF